MESNKEYKVIKDLKKVLQPIKEECSPEAEKEVGNRLTDLPKNTAVNAIIHTARPYGCWTTTVGTTVPPSEQ